MRIAIGSDHAGYYLKEEIVRFLSAPHPERRNTELNALINVGAWSIESCDYPDYAVAVGRLLLTNEADRGILICGSGVGACVAANKLPGIRACVCHDTYSARQGVEHDDMNVLTLGAKIIGVELARELITAFLNAHFRPEERFVRRLDKIKTLESHPDAWKTFQ